MTCKLTEAQREQEINERAKVFDSISVKFQNESIKSYEAIKELDKPIPISDLAKEYGYGIVELGKGKKQRLILKRIFD